MKAHRAAVLAEVATNEAALLPEQVAILQRCVGASTPKSMTALQQELRGEDVAEQRALAVALRRRIAAVRTEGLCLQLLEMSLGDQDVATAEQFKRLFTPVAAVVRATQQPVVEEAVAANTMHTVVEEVVAAAVAPPDWMEGQDEPDVVQDEDPLEEQDALLEEQDYLLALLDRWMVVEDCAHQPMEVEDEELLQATAERQAELLRDAHRDALQAAAERGPTKRGRPLCASPDSKGNSPGPAAGVPRPRLEGAEGVEAVAVALDFDSAEAEVADAEAAAQDAAADAAQQQRQKAVGRLKEAEEWVRVAEAEAAFRKDAAAAAAAAGFVGDVAGVAAKAEKKAAKARRSWLFALLWGKVLTDAPDAAAAALGKHAHGRKADPLTVLALAALKAFRSANPCGDGGIANQPISGELTPASQVHITAIFWHYFDLGKGPADLHCDVGAGRGAPQMLAALLLLVRTMGVEVVPLRVWVMQYCVAAGLAKWRELGGGGMAVAPRTTFSSDLADVEAGAPLRGDGGDPATHAQCFSTGMTAPVRRALAAILNAMRSVVCVAAYHNLVRDGLRAEEQTALKTTVTMYESGERHTCRFFKMLSAAEWAARPPQDDDDEDEEDLIVPVPIVLPIDPVPGRFTVTFAEGAPADAPARIVEQVGVPAQGAPGARQR
jgi:hypothetical protein